ncbi:hypothetical protein P154DRAFT_532257 [Amniculicola lignicola CBS 123094]|uniref:RING-type domain-containing protein n=1 Tax=Amniculicola lignicola CBS 123094 TaxID=1392246 RepID=A0A6A5WTI8_9PLEO|nr:hypothetical protein P154DRAFT_532257 [Amniculicola lignicola CBS 123094]
MNEPRQTLFSLNGVPSYEQFLSDYLVAAERPSNEPECPICRGDWHAEDYKGGRAVVTPCGHIYDEACLLGWFNAGPNLRPQQNTCPACREVLFSLTLASPLPVVQALTLVQRELDENEVRHARWVVMCLLAQVVGEIGHTLPWGPDYSIRILDIDQLRDIFTRFSEKWGAFLGSPERIKFLSLNSRDITCLYFHILMGFQDGVSGLTQELANELPHRITRGLEIFGSHMNLAHVISIWEVFKAKMQNSTTRFVDPYQLLAFPRLRMSLFELRVVHPSLRVLRRGQPQITLQVPDPRLQGTPVPPDFYFTPDGMELRVLGTFIPNGSRDIITEYTPTTTTLEIEGQFLVPPGSLENRNSLIITWEYEEELD